MSRQTVGRRRILSQLAGSLGYLALPAWLQAPGAYADLLDATARQTPGPFYPDPLPLERDNDLIILGDGLTLASGIVTHLRGQILSRSGVPVRNALVEIWQVDANGVYLHPRSGGAARRDPNFQGYGRFETSSSGEYYFRTVRPVPYPGRTPHIHVAVTPPGLQRWTSQCYIRGEPGNARDALFNSIPDARLRESVLVDFLPRAESVTGELDARFDIVLNIGDRH